MRERVTFIPREGVDPEAVPTSDGTGFHGPLLDSLREDKLTVPLDGLDPDLAALVRAFRRLRLRWVTPLSYDTREPFAARLSPGLHLSYSPLGRGQDAASTLCPLLQKFTASDCPSPESFTRLDAGSGSSAKPPVFYYFQSLENLDKFTESVTKGFCKDSDLSCIERLQSLNSAVNLDISSVLTDNTPQALEVKAFWPLIKDRDTSVPFSPTRRTEVGLLAKSEQWQQQQHELALDGVLAVLGEQSKPSVTSFSFPLRHRLSEASFSVEFASPTGLHPTMQLALSGSQPPVEDAECAPYAYLTLPNTIFADRYQLADDLFLASKNLTRTRYSTLPVDLEAPAYTTQSWGSNVLLELAPPKSSHSVAWTAEVPLHLRYLEPSETGYRQAELPYPAVFWACSTGESGWHRNPFDRSQLGYDELFDEDTVFWHVTPKPGPTGRLTSTITVPVLQTHGSSIIALGTAVVVALGFGWVLWKLLVVYWKSQPGPGAPKKSVEKNKKKQ